MWQLRPGLCPWRHALRSSRAPRRRAMTMWLDRLALSGARQAIDQIDDRMVLLFAHRQRLAALAGRIKAGAGWVRLDATREHAVMVRAQRRAQRCGLDPDGATQLMTLLIAHAHLRQRGPQPRVAASQVPPMSTSHASRVLDALLAALPPPRRWQPWVTRVPGAWQQAMVPRLLAQAIAAPEARRSLQPVAGRRIGIEVSDLGLRWVITLEAGQLRCSDAPAEATVSGSLTDLMLLASRLEDADTLFFQRRLTLTGDTELGLLLRNLLDRMPWESVPLGLRILLQRSARLAQRARGAHRARRVAA